jgi:hypothetical protein
MWLKYNLLNLMILGVILVFSPKAGNEFLHPLVILNKSLLMNEPLAVIL